MRIMINLYYEMHIFITLYETYITINKEINTAKDIYLKVENN